MFDQDRWFRMGFTFERESCKFVKPENSLDYTIDGCECEFDELALEVPILIMWIIDEGLIE